MTLRIPAKVLLHVWSYDFYDMTLSTGKQRRHMINSDLCRTWSEPRSLVFSCKDSNYKDVEVQTMRNN